MLSRHFIIPQHNVINPLTKQEQTDSLQACIQDFPLREGLADEGDGELMKAGAGMRTMP